MEMNPEEWGGAARIRIRMRMRNGRRATNDGRQATEQRGNGAADDGCVRKVEIIEVDKYLFGIDGAWIAKPFALSDRFLRFCSTLVHLSAK